MSYKRSFLRLFAAVTGLLAAVLELLTAALRLGAALLQRATKRVAPRVQATVAEPAWVPQAPVMVAPAPAPAPAPRAPAAPPNEEKLRGALVGMGYQASRVRAFTLSCRGRTEGLDVLVKEGIQKLSAN